MKKPIGIFDSGVGGTSIWKEIVKTLPLESTIYLSDSHNAPYGSKHPKEILKLSIKNTELLLEMGAKLIVVACNTATTNAIDHLRKNYDVPFIGIEPAIKPAALASKSKTVGILATKGTLNSKLFAKTSSKLDPTNFIEQVGEGLVEAVESGDTNSAALKYLLEGYLQPMVNQGIDHLVLGCTHYPYLKPLIQEIIGSSIPIIDSGYAVAKQTARILEMENIQGDYQEPFYKFYTNTKDTKILENLLSSYPKKSIKIKDF